MSKTDLRVVEAIEDAPLDPHAQGSLLLVYLGLRPGTFFPLYSFSWREGDEPKLICDDELAHVTEMLDQTGLAYSYMRKTLESHRQESLGRLRLVERIDFVVGANEKCRKRIMSAWEPNDDMKLGLALGFPPTAVKAYVINKSRSDLPKKFRKMPSARFAGFAFSQNNWNEELKVTAGWAKAVRKTSPLLYGYIMQP